MKKTLLNTICAVLLVISFYSSCKKTETPAAPPDPSTTSTTTSTGSSGNQSLILSNTTEYIIADVIDLSGMTKINLQDGNGTSFNKYYNKCPISQPFTLLEVKQAISGGTNMTELAFFFFTGTLASSFKQALHVGSYPATGISAGSVGATFSHPLVNTGTGASQTPAAGDYFEITEIKTISGKEYAIGKFSFKYIYGPTWSKSLWFKNGIFKIKTS